MFSKGITVVMLVLVFLIPGAYGISVSIAGGEGGSSFYDTATFNALDHDNLNVHSVVNGATLEQEASGNGNLHKSFGASSHRGERALITADVVNAGSWEYTQPSIDAGNTYAGVFGFLLTATDADSIKCTSGASDRLGDRASTSTEVSYGSLYNYQGDAFATNGGVQAWQSFGGADATSVSVKETASNPTVSSVTSTNVKMGGINRYSDYIRDGTFANPQLAETIGAFDHAAGKEIVSESSAYRSAGYRSNAKMNVAGTKYYLCYVDGFLSTAGKGFGFETEAFQQISGVANGGTIGISSSSSNNEGDISNANEGIEGTAIQPGEVQEYYGLTKSFRDGVLAENSLGLAAGDKIRLSSSASNRENDRVNANMNAVGNGQITNYIGSSSATLKTASASNGNDLSYLAVSGNMISCDASAFDAARNRVSVNTSVLGGSILYLINRATMDNTLVQSLTASQSVTGVSGSLLEIDATAINRAKEPKSQKNRFTNLNSINFGYGNGANVLAGNPTVTLITVT